MWPLLFSAPAVLAVEGALFGERAHLLIGVVLASMVLAAHLSVIGPPVRRREWLLTQTGLVLTAAAIALEARGIRFLPDDVLAWHRSRFHQSLAVALCLVAAAVCVGLGLRSAKPVLLLVAAMILGARAWQAIDRAWQSHQFLSYYEERTAAFLDAGVRYGTAEAHYSFAVAVAASLIGPALLILSRSRRLP